ncbi:unnamed protein product [Mesocestoides corti]|uniref:Tr-type G domain-containing protein n=1 Tax=Mesocestoides corti TaxID=53468 RepID=A0A3P6G764_MESCO|nr:unnamed protein product [Mesocestoides corti]
MLATNGIISFRQAGKLRFMDSTEAEQLRGITMKSSAVSLFYNPSIKLTRQVSPQLAVDDPDSYLVNLIDSPGHVDFSSDVSTAVRLCDSAIIVVDVVEGVCPQTRAVLRQAWNERLTLILVLNKIDRLFIQLGLTPIQMYDRILRVLEQINSILAEMFTADVLQQSYKNRNGVCAVWFRFVTTADQSTGTAYAWSTGLETTDDSHVYFSPDRANVVFTSAVDGWGFRISDFAEVWAERLKLPKKGLLKALWGDYYFIPSSNGGPPKVKGHARAKDKKPVFVQLIADQIYHIYKTLVLDGNRDRAVHIAERLGIPLEPRLLQLNVDSRTLLRSILSTWLPLGPAMFRAIVDVCPSPLNAVDQVRARLMLFGESCRVGGGGGLVQSILQEVELENGLNSTEEKDNRDPSAFPAITGKLLSDLYLICPFSALEACSSDADAPVIIFVSKIFWTDKQKNPFHSVVLSRDTPKSLSVTKSVSFAANRTSLNSTSDSKAVPIEAAPVRPDVDSEFIALSRIYSGRVKIGQRLFVLGPKFDGSCIPECLLDAEPSEFPLGPLQIPEADEVIPSIHSRRRSTSTSSSTNQGHSLSGGSFDGSHCEKRVLRHAYVAEIADLIQFGGGQNNVSRLSDPVCPIDSLTAGNVVGLIGPSLITSVPKSGLLVSSLRLVASPTAHRVLPLAGLAIWHGAPVVSLAIEPASASDPNDMVRLETGLRLLERSDPCAEVTISSKGEYLLHAAGEIHMQKCIEDLTKYFAPDLDLHTSPFVVPFRETVTEACPPGSYVPFDSLAFAKTCLEQELREKHLVYDEERENCVRLCLGEEGRLQQSRQPTSANVKAHGTTDPTRYLPLGMLQLPHSKSKTRVFIRVTAHPIPKNLLAWLETRAFAYMPLLLRSFKHKSSSSRRSLACLKKFEEELSAQLDEVPPEACSSLNWPSLKGRLLCLGPQQVGPNLLFSRLRSGLFRLDTAWGKPLPPWSDSTGEAFAESGVSVEATAQIPFLSYGKAILRGFQVATEQGPLCAEPLRGVAFVLEEIFAEDRMQLPTPRILTPNDLLEKPEDSSRGLVDTEPVADGLNVHENPDVKVDEDEPTEADPVLAALKAKRAAIQMRQKAHHLASFSRLNGDDFVDDDSDDDDNVDSEWSETSDEAWHSDNTNADSNNQSEDPNPRDSEEHVVEPEVFHFLNQISLQKRISLSDYYYWQRRHDNEWLSDVTPGLLTPAMARACTSAFQACPGQRLVLSMYDIELQCRGDVLGRMYAVLRKRYGCVTSEEMREGEECFIIHARLPVIESFDLTNEIRKRTSGLASLPQLRPGGWEVLDIDPFQHDASGQISALNETHVKIWQRQQEIIKRQRTTDREISLATSAVGRDGASLSDSDQDEELIQDDVNNQLNRLRTYIRDVRKRKGLDLHEQLVTSADKQRTLKKNK